MATTVSLTVDRFVLDTGLGQDILKATMNRYRSSARPRNPEDPGYIILFAHGTGFHKEHWEPTVQHLFELDKANSSQTRVLETWAIDCQNHGEAAPLNDEILLRKPDVLTIHHYADAFVKLYQSGLFGTIERGVQKIVIVGHSAGAIGVIFATSLFEPSSAVPFDMVILVDPPIFSPHMADKMTDMYHFVEKTTPLRRSIWESKEAAHEWMKTRVPWKFWDPRVLELYVKHGLRPLPTPFQPDKKGVALICSPAHEAAAFAGTPDTLKAISQMNKICNTIPFHLVFGARNDMFSREVQDSIHDPSVGRVITSVRRVKGAGHLVVQERPDRLAESLHDILNTASSPPVDNPKL